MRAEYVAKITGDISALEKTIKEAQGKIQRIADDEVLIQFNYDGNAKAFNKTFQSILNKHPELTIQLQYDLNKQFLEQETKKLQDLETLKMKMDPSDIEGELTEVNKKIEKTKANIELINNELKRLSVNNLGNNLTEQLDQAQKETKQITQDFEKVDDAVQETKSSLDDLYDKFGKYFSMKGGKDVSGFWEKLKDIIDAGDKELKELLADWKLLNETGSLSTISTGGVNSGGLLGTENVLLARTNSKDKEGRSLYSRTNELKTQLDEAYAAGVNVARILEVIGNEQSDVFFEVQSKASGNILGSYGLNNDNIPTINPDIFEATDEQIIKLINDIKALNELGIGVDINPENILYDKTKGFSLIDLDLKPATYKDQADMIEDILQGTIRTIQDFYEDLGDQSGLSNALKFENRMTDVANSIDKIQDSVKETIKETQDSNSPAEESKELGHDFGKGYAEGITEEKENVEKAAKELVDVALNTIQKSQDEKAINNLGKEIGNQLSKGITESASEIKTPTTSVSENTSTIKSGSTSVTIEQTSRETKKALRERQKAEEAELQAHLKMMEKRSQEDNKVFQEQIALMQKYIKETKKRVQAERQAVADMYKAEDLEYIDKRTKYLEEGKRQAEEYAASLKEVTKASENSDKLNAQLEKLNDLKKQGDTNTSGWSSQFIKQIDEAITSISVLQKQEIISAEDVENAKKIVSLTKEQAKLDSSKGANEKTRAKYLLQIEQYLARNTKLSKENRDSIEEIGRAIEKADNKEALNDLYTSFVKIKSVAAATGEETQSMFTKIGNRVQDMNSKFIAQFLSYQDLLRYLRQAVDVITELDYALVDLKKTTTMSNDELKQFYYTANDSAKALGTTTEEIINQAAAWSRLGYSSKEAATEMASLSAQFAAISPGMDLDTATDGLVSTMKAFGYDVNEVEREIMDVINKTGNTMATTNQEIVEMLTRSSAAMSAANNTLKETTALESAAVQITRNAETTGTAFRTISMRIRGYDEETEEYIGNIEELSGKIADLTKTAKTPGGLSLFTDASKTEYKSTYQILKEISEIYKDLSDADQATLLETLAGKRGGQVLAGILSNFSEVERAMKNMEESAGSADAEMSIIEESITFKINKLKETWVGVLQELIDNGMLGKLFDNLVKISEVLGTIITEIGPLGVSIAAIGFVAIAKDLNRLPMTLDYIAKALKVITGLYKGSLFGEELTKELTSLKLTTPKTITSLKNLGKTIIALPGPIKIAAAAIVALVVAISSTKKANDELRQSAKKLGDQYESSAKEISDYKTEIETLEETLNNNSTSYNDAKEARERLMTIQDELLDKYGKEYESINLINSAIEGQIDALDKLSDKQWQETKNEFNNQNLPGWDWMNRAVHGVDTNTDLMLKEMEHRYTTLINLSEKYAKELESNFGGTAVYNSGSGMWNYVYTAESVEELYDNLLKIQSLESTSSTSNAVQKQINSYVKQYKELIDTYGTFYKQYVLNERIFGTSYEESFNKITSAYEEYNKARLDGDEKATERAKNNITSLMEELRRSMVDEEGNISVEDLSVYNTILDLIPELQNEVNKNSLKIKLELDKDSVPELEQEVIDAINMFGSEEQLTSYVEGSNQSLDEAYRKIHSYAEQNKVDLQDILDLFREIEGVTLPERNATGFVDKFEAANGLRTYDEKGNQTRNVNYVDAAQELDSKYYDIASQFNDTRWKEVYATMQRIQAETDTIIDDATLFKQAVEAVAEEWTKVEQREQKAASTITNAVTGINTRLKSQFDELATVYDKVFNGENGFDLSGIDNDTLKGIVDSFTSFGEELGLTAEEQEKVREEAEKFMDVLTDESSEADDVQQAFNDIATAYFYSADGLKELNEETANSIKQQLEQMGIVNADEIVDYYLAQAEAEKLATENGWDLTTMTSSQIDALTKLGTISPIVAQQLALLALQERAAAGINFNESEDIAELERLAKAAGADVLILEDLARAKELAGMIEGGTASVSNVIEFYSLSDKIKNYDYTKDVKIDFSNIGGGTGAASGAGKDAADAYVEAFNKEKEELQSLRDAGLISEKEYLDRLKALIDKFFKDRADYAKNYIDEMKDYLNGMKSLYDSALSGVTTLLDRKITSANKGKEAAISALEAEKEAAEEAYQAQIDAIQEEIDALDDLIDKKNEDIDALNEQIDAINKANEARDRAITLQQAEYNLQRSMNQRTKLVYTGEPGQMVYERDEAAVRDNQESLRDAQDEIAKAKIQDQIDLIEKEIKEIEKQKKLLQDQQEELQKAMDETSKYYEKLIKEQEKYWDSIIEGLENQKSKWEELAEVESIAKAYASVKEVMESLGYTVDDVLNDTPGAFEAFKNAYLGILTDMNSGNQPFLDGLAYAVDGAKGAFGAISESAGEVEGAMDKIAQATAPLSDAATNITDVGNAASGASSGVSSFKTATEGISDNLNDINSVSFDNLTEALIVVKDKIKDILEDIDGSSGLVAALEKLNDEELLSGISKAFLVLGTSIEAVAQALGASGGTGNDISAGTAASVGAASSGASGNGEGGGDEGGGSGKGLVGAIEGIKSATDSYIGTEPEAEGDNAVGAFVAMKQSVDNVSKAIGIGDESGESGEETLSAAITEIQPTTNESLYGGGAGEGAIPAFEDFKHAIEECLAVATELLEIIQQLSEMELPTFSGGGGHYSGTAYQHYEGTAKLTGDWGVRKGGKSLVGELGQELVIRRGHFFTVGDHGPEQIQLQRGDVVLNHLQTREILNKRNVIVPKNSLGLASGSVLSPITSSALSLGSTPTMSGIRDVIADQTSAIQQTLGKLVPNVSTKPNVTINNPSFVVSGITGEQVMRQIEGSFEGLMLNAYQKATS